MQEETILESFYDKVIQNLLQQLQQNPDQPVFTKTPEICALLDAEEVLLSCIRQLNSNADFETVMNHVLGSILRFYGGSRAYIFEFRWKEGLTSNTHEACAPGVSPEIDNLQDLPISMVDTWIRTFDHGEESFVIDDVDALQNDALRLDEYRTLSSQNIKSLIVVPLRFDGELHGFLGVDDPIQNQNHIDFLINLTYFICNEIDKRHLSSELNKLSFSDSLTQFANRNAYNAYLQHASERTLRDTGVVFADLNSLKYMNDTYGHDYGDHLLRHMASILKKHFDSHHIFRISGDEFVIICENCMQSQFRSHVSCLRNDLTEKSEELASVGAIWKQDIADLSQTIYQAEQLMYQHKQRYHAASPGLAQEPSEVIRLFLQRMEEDRFEFYLQPQFDAKSGGLIGAEALARRITASGEVILPYEFVPFLEKELLISQLDFYLLDQICAKLRTWLDCGMRAIPISVNFSGPTLMEQNFVETFLLICQRHAVNPSSLIIEISRTRIPISIDALRDLIRRLQEHGIQIRIKHLTLGNDSSAMITLDGISDIKLDISLVRDMEEHFRVHMLVQTLVDLCHRMGQTCMASGVETQNQADMLRAIHCDSLQGFFFGHPMPADAFAEQFLVSDDFLPDPTPPTATAQLPDTLTTMDSAVFDLLSQTLENTYIYLSDLKTDFSHWSPTAVRYFGLPGEYIANTAQVWVNYIHPDDQHIFLEDIGRIMNGTSDRHDCEYRARNARGEYVWVRCNGMALRDPDGAPGLFAGTMMNLGAISKFDPVTGLLSSYEFLTYFPDLLAAHQSGSLLLFGIDHFKRINDLYGYKSGDRLLHYIAQQVQLIPNCCFFRMDGDKLACVIPNASRNDMEQVYAQVSQLVDHAATTQDIDLHLSASCGAVLYPQHGEQLEVLRANAEYALEQAKKNRRGSLAIYSEELHKKSVLSFRLQEILRKGILNNFRGFSLCYQPQICTETNRIFGAEALLRFSSPEIPQISPAEFIPVLEETGTIREVGAWVLQTALYRAVQWRKLCPDFRISINASYLQMCLPDFREMVIRELELSKLPPEALILELTESCKITDPERLKTDFDFFKEHHIQLALDDFGTGYASIAMLRQLTPSWIKIDHTFVSSITESRLDQAIIEYILQLCRHADIQVCIEGIENAEILRIVRQYQPELLQGYYFSKPLPPSEFEALFLKHDPAIRG